MLRATSWTLLLLLAWPASSRADVAWDPPPKPCTIDARWTPGNDCVACDNDARDSKSCERRYASTGFQKECRGPGQASWSEVWCRKHQAVAPGKATPRDLAAHLRSVTASSSMPQSAGYEFVPENLTDGDLSSCWQPARGTGGKGETVLFSFDAEVGLKGLSIANGFQVQDRFGDEFVNNSRLKSARLVFSDASEERIQLPADQRGLVDLTFKPRKTKWLKLIVEEVHPGSRWKDLAISEIVLVPADP